MTLNTSAGISLPAMTVLGHRKNGSPVYNIAGGSVPAEPVVVVPAPVVAPPAAAEPRFTAEDIQKARMEEKDKLYGKIQTIEEQNKKFLAEIEEQRAAREATQAEAVQKATEKAAAVQAKAEDEMTAKQLLTVKEKEWQGRFDALEAEREKEKVLREKEGQFNALQNFIQRRVTEESANIAPELIDYVNGNTPDEVEASIKLAVDKTNAIMTALQEAAIQQRAGLRGTSPTGYSTTGPMDSIPGQKTYSLEELKNLPMSEYAAIRGQLGVNTAQSQRGLYG